MILSIIVMMLIFIKIIRFKSDHWISHPMVVVRKRREKKNKGKREVPNPP